MSIVVKKLTVAMLFSCFLIFVDSLVSIAQESKSSIEQNVAQLERQVQQLQQRIALLEARISDGSAKVTQKSNTTDWHDKNLWRKLRKGMSMAEVSALLGEPEQIATYTFTITWRWGYGKVDFSTKSNSVEGWSEP